MTASKAITEEEAQLYDRQIRLWGLDAQKRLRASRVLVAGIKGLGCEVVKNLVLAGINSLTMIDHENLTKEDGDSQFLAPRDKVGSNRAEASLERVRQLNPGVEIKVDTSHLDSKNANFFSDNFDLVVITNFPKDTVIKINQMCRESGIKFFAGDVFGFFGYSFMDLVEHEFVEEVKQIAGAKPNVEEQGSKASTDDSPPKAKKARTVEVEEPETKMVKNSMKFVSLENALKVDWTQEAYKKRIKRMDPSYFLLQVLFEFQSREGCSPRISHRDDDLTLLKRLRDDVAQKLELPTGNKLTNEDGDKMLPLLFSELSPVAAIVGGVLAQEIIKVISNKDTPHNNFFLYNPIESCGVVETIGY